MLENFFKSSPTYKKLLLQLQATTKLQVHTLLYGPTPSIKTELAKALFGNIKTLTPQEHLSFEKQLQSHDRVIIEQCETLTNIQPLRHYSGHIIAIANYETPPRSHEEFFAFKIEVPSLTQNPDELALYIESCAIYASKLLQAPPVDCNEILKDIKQDIDSVLPHILKKTLLSSMGDEELNTLLKAKAKKDLLEKKSYQEMIEFFEAPILEAGLELYSSQSKLALALDINRNTLRKKLTRSSK